MSVSVDTPQFVLSWVGEDNQKHKLVLAGRGLPDKEGGLQLGIKQRSTTTFYGGNPIGTRQVFGPTLDDTAINGKWSDRWIGSVTSDGISVTPEATIELDGQQVKTLGDADSQMENLCAFGFEVTMTWASKIRVGTLAHWDPTWRTVHDLEWRMEFEWLSRGETPTIARIPSTTPLDKMKQWTASLNDLGSLVDTSGLSVISDVVNAVNQSVKNIAGAINNYIDQAQQVVSTVLSPVEVAVGIVAALDSIRSQADTFLVFLELQVDRAVVQPQVVAGKLVAGSVGDAIAAASYMRALRTAARTIRDDAAEEQRTRAAEADERLLDIYIAVDGDDLRHVSTVEYGTPTEWKRLQQFNGFTGSALTTGQVVLVPDLAALGQAA